MTAGYSKRSLVEKLGIKAQARIAIIGAPPGYSQTLGSLPGGVVASTRLTGDMDFIHAFFSEAAALRRQFPVLKKALGQLGSDDGSSERRSAEDGSTEARNDERAGADRGAPGALALPFADRRSGPDAGACAHAFRKEASAESLRHQLSACVWN